MPGREAGRRVAEEADDVEGVLIGFFPCLTWEAREYGDAGNPGNHWEGGAGTSTATGPGQRWGLTNWVIGAGALATTVWVIGGSSVRERAPSLR